MYYMYSPVNHRCRIAITGGPGGGKTTAADLFRREIGESVVVVPEAASLLFAGGFPRTQEPEAVRSVQHAIYHVQRNLEDVQSARFHDRVLLCDRGTVDGAAYWPQQFGDFFESLGSSLERELNRYTAVVYFETAAVGGISIEGGNPIRTEGLAEAVALDQKLREIWAKHPRFLFVPHAPSFMAKITQGLSTLQALVREFS